MSILRKYPLASSAALAIAVAAALSACGGGSSSSDTPASTPSTPVSAAPVTKSVPVKVIDGAIKNALVCLDKNANGACDEGEPSARTDAAGNTALSILEADVGKYPVLALVGTDAVDADYGPVTTAFSMTAPADKPAVVSPLTTLVHLHAQNTGLSSTDAEAFLKAQSGIDASMFADYTTAATSDTAAGNAKALARLIVVSAQEAQPAVRAAVGQKDASGATVTQADADKVVAQYLIDLLSYLGAAAVDPAVRGAADPVAAFKAVVVDLLADAELTDKAVVAKLGVQRLAAAEAATQTTAAPAASAALRMLTFKDVSNYYAYVVAGTAADNTPDANNRVRFYNQHFDSVGGIQRVWNASSSYERRGDVHWSGTAWVDCPLGFRSTSTVRDAAGNSSYEYCDGSERGTSKRATVDIAGRTLASVVNEIRALPGSDSGVNYSQFGPTDLNLLGNASFPAGAKLTYQSNTVIATAPSYDVTSIVSLVSSSVAAGGDTRSNAALACNQITSTTPSSSWISASNTLDSLIAVNRGTPCIYSSSSDSNGNSGTRNEWWDQSTLSIGTLSNYYATLPAGTSLYYTNNVKLRLAFSSGNAVTYYVCQERRRDAGVRNCSSVGTGSYAITTIGDARVMSFTNPPTLAAKLTYNRILVERGGKVYYGYVSKPVTFDTVRLNLDATNALLTKLGLPAYVPQ